MTAEPLTDDEREMSEARAAYDRAWAELERMTSAPGGPGASWRWGIPANKERDSDLILAAALEHMPALMDRLADLTRDLAAARSALAACREVREARVSEERE